MRFPTKLEVLFFFSVIAMMVTMIRPAHAEGVVSLQTGKEFYSGYTIYSWTDLTSACVGKFGLMYGGLVPTSVSYVDSPGAGGNGSAVCSAVSVAVFGTSAPVGIGTVYYRPKTSCPVNSTGTTTCTCNAGYSPNIGATACVLSVVCPAAGAVYSSGFYSVGTTPGGANGSGAPPLRTCDGSCEQGYNGASVSARALVAGVYNYFAKGSYVSTGANCSVLNNVPAALNIAPLDSCAPGQSSITMGSVTKCLNSATGETVSPNSASAVAAAPSAASAVAAAGAAAGAAGLSASGVADAKSVAAGVYAAGGSSGSAAPLAGLAPGDPLQGFCAQNPTADICKAQTAQPVAGGALPTLGTGSWYVKTYPNGVGGVLTTNFNTMKATPLFGLINNIVPTISGAAHNGCFTLPIWRMGNQVICIPPSIMTALGLFMILTALFAARGLVFGG